MRKVNRTQIPEILLQNFEIWTEELIQAIDDNNGYSNVPKYFKTRYKNDEILTALQDMYKGVCCYCETEVGINCYDNIEHLKPKSRVEFHHLSFEWTNLHLCCQICNNKKNVKWDFDNPIVDPTSDNPLDFLTYEEGFIIGKDDRGEVTIDHAKLNRRKLLIARQRALLLLLKIITEIKGYTGSRRDSYIRELEIITESGAEFKGMFDFFLDNIFDISR